MQTVTIVGDDTELRKVIYDQLVADRLDKIVMMDVPSFTEDLWNTLCDRSFVTTILDKTTGEPKCLVWLNDYVGETARIHFTCFSKYQHIFRELGKIIFKFLDNNIGHTAYYGLTPKVYRHVLAGAKDLGFTFLATMPKSVYMDRKKAYVDAVFSIRYPFSGEI